MRALALFALLAAASCGSNVVASEPAPPTDSGFDLGAQPTDAYCPPKEPTAGTECLVRRPALRRRATLD